ncbi:MAG TPA: universal stress protein [Thermodesulfovibrionales bacterium]|nr:universal stress protein [Thermodesulfovibrionales bacterium]
MKKILVAIDESENALRAVDFTAKLMGVSDDVQITLFHVLPDFPPMFWDDGHILGEQERKSRNEVIQKWKENQQLKLGPIFKEAAELLEKSGFRKEQIETKSQVEALDVVADCILKEARDGGYQMLVIGRHGYSKAKRLVMGSITNMVITNGTGLAICVVE